MPHRCRIGLTDDFLLDDGRLSFPGYDLGPLPSDPRVELARITGDAWLRPEALAGIDILLSVPSTAAVEARSLAGLDSLVGILRVGVGCEDVDLDACTAAGVAVVVPSEAVRRPTAVAALALILALATRLLEKDRLTRAGPLAWDGRSALRGRDLTGQILGLVGCGSIGSDLASLVRPLGMVVVAHDPALGEADALRLGVRPVPLDVVLSTADYLSIHCPLTESTRGLIDATAMARMRPGACLVNTARGGIVDQAALVRAIRSGHLGGAGLDVFDPEPLAADDPLLGLDRVVLGAHALNWTEELDRDLAAENVAAALDLMAGRVPHRVVNAEVLGRPDFAARLGALARRVGAIKEGLPA